VRLVNDVGRFAEFSGKTCSRWRDNIQKLIGLTLLASEPIDKLAIDLPFVIVYRFSIFSTAEPSFDPRSASASHHSSVKFTGTESFLLSPGNLAVGETHRKTSEEGVHGIRINYQTTNSQVGTLRAQATDHADHQ
jgi:hypothetical protein